MKRKLFYSLCLIGYVFFTGCEKDDEIAQQKPHTQPEEAQINEVSISPIATIKRDGATIKFLEVSPGEVLIHTSIPADKDSDNTTMDKITSILKNSKSSIEIYQALAGQNINNDHLKALKEAEVRMEEKRSYQASLPVEWQNKIAAHIEEQVKKAGASIGRTQACTGDFYNDNWGAQWFMDNYSMTPKPVRLPNGQTFHPPLPAGLVWTGNTNAKNFTERISLKSFYHLNVMAADFKIGAKVHIDSYSITVIPPTCPPPCDIRIINSHSRTTVALNPRDLHSVIYATSPQATHVTLEPDAGCARIHYARLKDM